MGIFNINPGLAVWTWVAFGILFIILKKAIFPNVMKNIKTRETKIARSVENASNIEKRLKQIEEEHVEILKNTKNEADEIIRKTRTDAENLRKKLIADAEREAEEMIEQAKIKIAEEREYAIHSMRAEIADFVCDAAEKLISRSFVDDEDREWAKELAETL
jgi:F-type H+-transporting ATPase subunit b